MGANELKVLLRSLLNAGNVVTVKFDDMRQIRKELNRFSEPIQIEILKSDFDTVTFREMNYNIKSK